MHQIKTQQELIMECIYANLQHYQKLIVPYREQRKLLLAKEESIWHNDIMNQYGKIIRSVILTDLMMRLQGLDVLEAMIFLEDMDVEQL